MKRGWFSLLVLAVLVAASSSQALTYEGTVVLTCTDVTAAGTGAAILDRDNTGAGREGVRLDVTDGAGTLLFTLTFQNILGTYSGGLIPTEAYTTPPAFNPLTFRATSLAGNGLPAVESVTAQGTCAGLPRALVKAPTLSPLALASLATLLAATGFLLARRAN